MVKFEIISKYENCGLNLPVRKTACSAGYDFQVAEDIIIPPYANLMEELISTRAIFDNTTWADALETPIDLKDMANLSKATDAKPTLVPTGIKCKMENNQYLALSVRSSCPLKYWLVLANSTGIIDADYYNNPDNEGHIFFQIINFSPFPIMLKKGDTIGQGIIMNYNITDDDAASGERTGGLGSTGG